ncbi:MAG: hypothetical protein FH748_01515 [Balneolaceae bacterium]|nr:hypothetical protein [Balneolaceae bacterium]
MHINKYILLITSVLFLCSCINNTEDLTPDDDIDPEDISYADDIQPIFNQSCGGSGCHVGSAQNNVDLSSYSSTINSVGASYGINIVAPGDPDGSPLVDKIESNPDKGSRMPLTGGFLSANQIATIRAWIEAGAEDN